MRGYIWILIILLIYTKIMIEMKQTKISFEKVANGRIPKNAG